MTYITEQMPSSNLIGCGNPEAIGSRTDQSELCQVTSATSQLDYMTINIKQKVRRRRRQRLLLLPLSLFNIGLSRPLTQLQ